MPTLAKYLVMLCCLLVSSFSLAESATSEAAYYRATLQLQVDGADVMSPSVTARFGDEAQLTLSAADGSEWQVRLTANPPYVTKDGVSAVQSRLQLFKTVGGAQALVAEPMVVSVLGEEAKTEFPLSNAAASRAVLSLDISVASEDDLKSQLGAAFGKVNECSSPGKSEAGINAPRCCGGRCPNGEAFTCCNVIQCCICGRCCSP